MNINTESYGTHHGPHGDPPASLSEDIDRHHLVLMEGVGLDLTGEVALLSPADRSLAELGVLQVWSRCEDGTWAHVTPEGVLVTTADPLGGEGR